MHLQGYKYYKVTRSVSHIFATLRLPDRDSNDLMCKQTSYLRPSIDYSTTVQSLIHTYLVLMNYSPKTKIHDNPYQLQICPLRPVTNDSHPTNASKSSPSAIEWLHLSSSRSCLQIEQSHSPKRSWSPFKIYRRSDRRCG